ncbi:LPS assembly lipoprotein LptE [Aquibaculum sediminis]|uniref:LPS assembly lipoprotein LptE n=1 Tax=Aquibaculum sediminis TaxID=3231907 RepID=UPI0034564D75
MWWSRRHLLGALGALPLAAGLGGCVVRPLYGTAGSRPGAAEDGAPGLATIAIQPISARRGQMLHNELRDLLNPRGQPVDSLYDLRVEMSENTRRSGLRRTETATRGTLTMRANYRLFLRETGEALTSGRAQSIVGFNLVESGYANHASAQSAQERAVRELAQEIRRRLALFLAETSS